MRSQTPGFLRISSFAAKVVLGIGNPAASTASFLDQSLISRAISKTKLCRYSLSIRLDHDLPSLQIQLARKIRVQTPGNTISI